jgi:biopolymer transport protein ExbB
MANVKKESGSKVGGMISGIIIVACVFVGYLVWSQLMGAASNFEGGDPEKGHPLNTLGMVYKGGFIVPILVAINLIIIIFSLERFFTLSRSKGKGNIDTFVTKIKGYLETKEITSYKKISN